MGDNEVGFKWLNKQPCRVVGSGAKSRLGPVGHRGSTLCPGFLNNFIHDIDEGAECNLRKIADGTKLRGVTDTPEDLAVIQGDIKWLEKQADKYLKVSKEKGKVPHLGQNKTMNHSLYGWDHPAEKHLGRKGPEGPDGHQAPHEPAMCCYRITS